MKQYFAKLLPVPDGYRRSVKNDQGIPIDYEYEVKLYICSRDIQLGDTYYHDSFHPYPKGDVADTNTKVMDAHMMISNEGEDYDGDESFRVLGEVSMYADWVKEGDEFDKEDIHAHGCGPNWNDRRTHNFFTIKCPTCKQFH